MDKQKTGRFIWNRKIGQTEDLGNPSSVPSPADMVRLSRVSTSINRIPEIMNSNLTCDACKRKFSKFYKICQMTIKHRVWMMLPSCFYLLPMVLGKITTALPLGLQNNYKQKQQLYSLIWSLQCIAEMHNSKHSQKRVQHWQNIFFLEAH